MTDRKHIRIPANQTHPGDQITIAGNTYTIHRVDDPNGFTTIHLDHTGGYFPARTLTLNNNPKLDVER